VTVGPPSQLVSSVPSSKPSLPVRRLLEGPLDSFEKLEIVIALRAAQAMTSSVKELSKKLQMPVDVIERTVEELVRGKYVEVAGGLTRLILKSEDLVPIDELVALYDSDRILVVRTLSEIAMDKIRGMAARTFADAFHLRKKKDSEDG
jgi:hypothetical protein